MRILLIGILVLCFPVLILACGGGEPAGSTPAVESRATEAPETTGDQPTSAPGDTGELGDTAGPDEPLDGGTTSTPNPASPSPASGTAEQTTPTSSKVDPTATASEMEETTPGSTATSSPKPVATASPLPTPTPTPTPDGVLGILGRDYPKVHEIVMGYSWVMDGITADEQMALQSILDLAQRFPPSSQNNSRAYGSFVEALQGHGGWLGDDLTESERVTLQQFVADIESTLDLDRFILAFQALLGPTPTPTPTATPSAATDLPDFSWAQDGLTNREEAALEYLEEIQRSAADVASFLFGLSSIEDGIDRDEEKVLCFMATTDAEEILQLLRNVGWGEAASLLSDCEGGR